VPHPPAATPTPLQRTLPNALTAARIGLAGGVFALLSLGLGGGAGLGNGTAVLLGAASLFIVAALTDAADGILARRWNAITTFGRVMDPLADKLLVLGAFVYLGSPLFYTPEAGATTGYQASGVAAWMVVVILGRELAVTSIRGVYEARGVDFSADWSGKAKMICQSIAVPAVLILLALGEPGPQTPAWWAIRVIIGVTVAVTALSGVTYLMKAVRTGGAA